MSFQMALEDAQIELALDETFAFLDGFDLSAYDQQLDSSDAFCGSTSFSGFNSSSSSFDDGCLTSGDDDFTTDSDDSLSSLLSQFADGSGGPVFDFSDDKLSVDATSISPKRVEQMQQKQPIINKPQPQLQTQPLRKKKVARTSKATASASTASASAPTPLAAAAGPATKRPRKHNRIEILKLREQIEELQACHAQLQNFGGDRQKRMQTSTVAAGAISVSVSVAVAEQYAMWQNKTKQRKTSTVGTTATTTLSTTTSGGGAPQSVWLELAVEQYKQLQESEELNRKLRDTVAKQLKVTSSFQSILTKKTSFKDLDLLTGTSAAAAAAAAAMQSELLSPQDQKMIRLCRRMESQFHEGDHISHTISVCNDVTSVFTTSQTKQDAVRGPLFELTTNTPVPSGFQQLGRIMWDHIVEKKELPVADSQLMPQLAQQKPFLLAFHDKHVQMKFSSKFGDLLVDGSVALGKIEEANRVIITIASIHSVVNSDLVLRESAWIIVSEDASTNPASDELRPFSWSQLASSKSLFQTFYRLHCEKHDPRSATGTTPFAAGEFVDEKTSYLREFVMKALSDNMRQHMVQLQNSLLSEVGSLMSNMMNVRCPMIECSC